MKKLTKICALFLVSIPLLSMLPSCSLIEDLQYNMASNDEKARYLFEWGEKRLDKSSSYTEGWEMAMRIPSSAGELVMEASGAVMYENLNTDDYKTLTTIDLKLTLGDEKKPMQEENQLNGFANGKMFATYGENKLYSLLTAEEYLAYKEEKDSMDIDFSLLDDAENCKFTLDEETMTVSHVGTLPEEFSEQFAKAFDFDKLFESFDIEVKEPIAELTISFTEDRYLKGMTLDFSYEDVVLPEEIKKEFKDGYKPAISIVVNYSDWNSTGVDVPNFDDYTEVADLRALEDLEDAIEDLTSAKSSKHTVDSWYEISAVGATTTVTEKDTIEYSTDEKGNYSLETTVKLTQQNGTQKSSSDMTVTYEDGTLTILDNDSKKSESKKTDAEEAKTVLAAQFLIFDYFIPENITEMTIEENKWVFTIKDLQSVVMENANIKSKAVGKFTVTLENGKPIQYDFEMTTNTKVSGRSVKLKETLTFKLA